MSGHFRQRTPAAWLPLLMAAAGAGAECPFVFTHMVDGFEHACVEIEPGVWDLTLTVREDNVGTVKVESRNLAAGGQPRIGELRLLLTDPEPASPSHVGLILRGNNLSPASLAGLGRLTPVTSTGVELAVLEMIVNGDVGHLTATRIYEATILGDLLEGITLPEARDQGPQEVSAFIGSLTVMGDLLGPIVFDPDDDLQCIDELIVGGALGNLADPFDMFVVTYGFVQCRDLHARLGALGFGRLEVMGQLNGEVSGIEVSAGYVPPGCGDAGVFVGGNAKADIVVSGAFAGDLTVGGFLGDGVRLTVPELRTGRRLQIGGDVRPGATVEVEGRVDGFLEVGGRLEGTVLMRRGFDGTVVVGAGALAGQVTIDSQGGLFGWNGTVRVGSDELRPGSGGMFEAPHYEASDEHLGGGAVGLTPFGLHGGDSSPEHGAVRTGALAEVRLGHYGPIRIAHPGTLPCVKIERRRERRSLAGGVSEEFEDVTNGFSPELMTVSASNPRELVVRGAFECGYEYRVTPVWTELLCDAGAGSPVESYEYGFTLRCGER